MQAIAGGRPCHLDGEQGVATGDPVESGNVGARHPKIGSIAKDPAEWLERQRTNGKMRRSRQDSVEIDGIAFRP